MKAKDFTTTSPGKLVATVEGQLAFVPNPIPNTIALDNHTIVALAKAERALGSLSQSTQQLLNPWLVAAPMLDREAILSSRIEGTITTPENLVLLRAGERPPNAKPKQVEHTQEVSNYIDAMHYGLSQLEKLPICLRLMKGMHGILLKGVRGAGERPGEFRTAQNWIKGRPSDEIQDARFVPPPPEEMKVSLSQLEKDIHRLQASNEIPALVVLAAVHYQFETIHPFRDGNGRIGRLLIPLMLCKLEILKEPLFYPSAFFERNHESYNDHMLSVSRTGNWTPWMRFFLRGVREAAEESLKQATGLMELRLSYHQRFQSARSSALLLKLIDELFQVPSISITKAASVLDITRAAASHNLKKLQDAGIIEEGTGRVRNQVFFARKIIRHFYEPSDGVSQ